MKLEEAVSPVIGVMLMMVVTIVIAAVVSGLAGNLGDLGEKTGPTAILSDPVMDWTTSAPTINKVTIRYTGIDEYYEEDEDEPTGWYYEYNDGCAIDSGYIYLLEDTGGYYGMIFTSLGGDAFDLKDLQMSVSSNNLAAMVDYDSKRSILDLSGKYSIPDCEIGDTEFSSGSDWNETLTVTGVTITDSYGNEYDENDLDGLIEQNDNSEYIGYFYKIDPETDDDTIIRPGDSFEFALDSTHIAAGGNIGARGVYGDLAIACTNDGIGESFAFERGSGNEWMLSHKPSGAVLASRAFEFPDT